MSAKNIRRSSNKDLVRNLTDIELRALADRWGSVKDIAKQLGVNYSQCNSLIQEKLELFNVKLDITKQPNNWTLEEIEIVKSHYSSLPRKDLEKKLPNRGWTAIKLMGRRLNLFRELSSPARKSDLSKLLEDTTLAYYWMGFLMADAHFTEKRISLKLAIKDKKHVAKFAKFVKKAKIATNHNSAYISPMDSIVVAKLRHKFNIKNNKTKFPCFIPVNNPELFLSLLIGFIDGDGCILKRPSGKCCSIKIKCYHTWIDNFKIFKNTLEKISGFSITEPLINNQGYAEWNITKTNIIRFLKLKTIELNLPVLRRKWDRIDEAFIADIRFSH